MQGKKEKYFYYLSIIFIVCVVIANVIAGRLIQIGSLQLPASILVFPITFIIGDLLTEIYGFKKALKVTIIGFLSNLLLTGVCLIAVNLPAPEAWELSSAYSQVFSYTPRIFIGSFSAFLIGSIINSYLMVLLKKLTKGKLFWLRTILSTFVGEFLDSFVFCFISFVGVLSFKDIMLMVLLQASIKILYETLFTPILYLLRSKILKKEDVSIEQ